MTDPRIRLRELGLELPEPAGAMADYVPAVRVGSLVTVSGQVPLRDGKLVAKGPVPSACAFETAEAGARRCVLNGLAAVDALLAGHWSEFERVVRVGVFVASDPGFTEQHRVANAASRLLVEVFGEAGRHARAAVGAVALPLDAAVEVELTLSFVW